MGPNGRGRTRPISEDGADGALQAALGYARRGWPVLPVRAGGKDPLTRHGVKDASSDRRTVARWWRRWPAANVAVACGLPGPQVLDIDDLEAGAGALAATDGAPEVATANGRHRYLAGQARGTIELGFGELRGRGSYVVAPPSIHPSGREYVWLREPRGRLPAVPAMIARAARTAGRGQQAPLGDLVPHRRRHPHLRDAAVRLVRAGITDERRLTAYLELEFRLCCVRSPRPAPGYFHALARWAARTRIADRERRTG
jgi:Bifunctional DNA primase/polymerase, N-terminal